LFADPAWTLVYWDDDGMIYLPEETRRTVYPELARWTVVNPDDTHLGYLATGDQLSSAAEELQRFVSEYPQVLRARRLLGHVLLRAGRPGEAAEAFAAVIDRARRPRASDYHSLAFALDTAGRKTDALAAAQAGLERWPRDTDLLDLAGVLTAEIGDPKAGLKLLERAARLGPPSAQRDANLRIMRNQPAASAASP
jgi:tetratricopeptide (TPR) repeat protein